MFQQPAGGGRQHALAMPDRAEAAGRGEAGDRQGAPLLIVNTNDLNFVDRRSDLEELIARMEEHREGVAYVTPGAEQEGAS
jgi:hypothetical protein